jgi:predicted TPR repeat methyltransferase
LALAVRDREAALRAAVGRDPANAAAHSELATHYYGIGEFDKSVREFELACKLAPEVPQGHYNLAATLNACDEKSAALNVVEQAEQDFPDSALIHYGKACVLQSLGRLDESLASFTIALELDPHNADTWYGVGVVLLRQGDPLRASSYFERALDVAPNHTGARYMRDALSGQARTRPDESFVRDLFESYAPYYDEHMLEQLGYRAPELLCNTLADVLNGAPKLRVLDLGCGTGLVGSRLRPQAAQLIGVDLAQGMLNRARALACYDRLECCDVVEYLRKQQQATQDLVIAADLFIYFADLEETFAAIKRVLQPGGIFAFTVEEHRSGGWSVGPSGRFRHSRAYLETLRNELDYSARSFEQIVIRHDGGEPCQGFVIVWSAEPETNSSL